MSISSDREPYENVTRIFLIKIEFKDNPYEGSQVTGEIKDVLSGEKGAINDLMDIIEFIIPYMKKMGVRINWLWPFAAFIDQRFGRRKKVQGKPDHI